MVITDINSPELSKYAALDPHFERAFAEIKRIMENGAEDGKHVFEGDALYANLFTYESKAEEDSAFEAHEKYIDIQVVLEGEEIIGFETVDKLTPKTEFSEDGDYILYHLNDSYDKVRLCHGELAIIFPKEPHAPGIAACDNKPSRVRKLVVKVLA